MKKLMPLALAMIVCLSACGSGGGGSSGSDDFAFLFVQEADSATLAAVEGSETEFTLTLDGADPTLFYFSDRPEKIAGQMDVAELIDTWWFGDNSFGEDPPNAALEISGADAGQDVLMLTLQNPVYDAGAATLTFDAVFLETSDSLPAEFTARGDPVEGLVSPFGPVTLFVDDAQQAVLPNYGNSLMQTLIDTLGDADADLSARLQTMANQLNAISTYESTVNHLQMELMQLDPSNPGDSDATVLAAMTTLATTLETDLPSVGLDSLTEQEITQALDDLNEDITAYPLQTTNSDRQNVFQAMVNSAVTVETVLSAVAETSQTSLQELMTEYQEIVSTTSSTIQNLNQVMRSIAQNIQGS